MNERIEVAETGEDRQEFFATEMMQLALQRAVVVLIGVAEKNQSSPSGNDHYQALMFAKLVLDEMIIMPSVFDSSCQFNIKHLGNKFLEHLQLLGANDSDIETVIAYCYRFVVEFELKANENMSVELLSGMNDIEGLDFFNLKTLSRQVKYAKNHMVIHILREYINHPHMSSLSALPAAIQTSEVARIKSDEELNSREERVTALEQKLKGYENAYNFVGLYQGFSNLKKDKAGEKDLTFKFLIFLGLCMVVAPLLKLFGIIGHNEDLIKEGFAIFALFAFELIVIYFFRIALQNFRSIKAQLMQIDLRMTLCQFINAYVEFASDARKNDKDLLTRFEQVIFSGIVSDDSGIPSTFDGLEQVAKILDSLKPR